mmetsp:Transcript_23796/g.74891  ORF Transcript_23796/g.74891 Transcript_23796/m.74891 type:complete len:244 (+) Transcript_23796:2345-3076(+)
MRRRLKSRCFCMRVAVLQSRTSTAKAWKVRASSRRDQCRSASSFWILSASRPWYTCTQRSRPSARSTLARCSSRARARFSVVRASTQSQRQAPKAFAFGETPQTSRRTLSTMGSWPAFSLSSSLARQRLRKASTRRTSFRRLRRRSASPRQRRNDRSTRLASVFAAPVSAFAAASATRCRKPTPMRAQGTKARRSRAATDISAVLRSTKRRRRHAANRFWRRSRCTARPRCSSERRRPQRSDA